MPGKKYSVNWENGQAVSFEVNGVRYKNLDEIPEDEDLRKLQAMVDAAEEDEFFNAPAVGAPGGQAVKPGMPVEKIILMVFSGVAGLMLLIALISAGSIIRTAINERSAPGRVVDVVFKRVYVNQEDRVVEEFYYPVVSFTADDGKRRSLQMATGSNIPEYEKGDEVTVLYNPDHPLEARIKSFGGAVMMWILPGITGLLGVSFLGAVLLVRRLMQPEE
jgi:hypothetical protein